MHKSTLKNDFQIDHENQESSIFWSYIFCQHITWTHEFFGAGKNIQSKKATKKRISTDKYFFLVPHFCSSSSLVCIRTIKIKDEINDGKFSKSMAQYGFVWRTNDFGSHTICECHSLCRSQVTKKWGAISGCREQLRCGNINCINHNISGYSTNLRVILLKKIFDLNLWWKSIES